MLLFISMVRRKDNKKAVDTFQSVFKLFLFFSGSQDKFSQHQTSNFNIRIRLLYLIIIRKMPQNLRTEEVKQN